MRSISAVQQKGGVGKSTLTCNLAAYYAREKMRVWLIDMDPQASAFRWGEVREKKHADQPRIRVVMAHVATLATTLRQAKEDGADVVLIDTPQATSVQDVDPGPLIAAGSHLLLMPCKPYFYDANAMLKTVREARAEGRNAFVVFNEVEKGAAGIAHVEKARAGLKALGDKAPNICDKTIKHSVDFPDAAAQGLGVADTVGPTIASYKDLKALAVWALEQSEEAVVRSKARVKALSPAASRAVGADKTKQRKRA